MIAGNMWSSIDFKPRQGKAGQGRAWQGKEAAVRSQQVLSFK
jgi:hypothetical protein